MEWQWRALLHAPEWLTGDHDALTVRALVVDETAVVTVDVIGIDANLSARARARAYLPDQAITITATHTHGGPVSMPGDCLRRLISFHSQILKMRW